MCHWQFNRSLIKLKNSGSLQSLWTGILIIGLLYLSSEIFNCFRIRVNNQLEQKVLFDMRNDLHQKLLKLSVTFMIKESGELASRVVEDVANVERALLDGTEQGHELSN